MSISHFIIIIVFYSSASNSYSFNERHWIHARLYWVIVSAAAECGVCALTCEEDRTVDLLLRYLVAMSDGKSLGTAVCTCV